MADEQNVQQPSRRQAVVDDGGVGEGPVGKTTDAVGVSSGAPVGKITTSVQEAPKPEPSHGLPPVSEVERNVQAALRALDDSRVIAKLSEVFARFDELRPDAFRSPSRWQQRLKR